MRLYCHGQLNGRLVVESVAGDVFEYRFAAGGGERRLRLAGAPQWRRGQWPSDAETIAQAARQVAAEYASRDPTRSADVI